GHFVMMSDWQLIYFCSFTYLLYELTHPLKDLISRNYSTIPTAHTIKILIWNWPHNKKPNIIENMCAKLYGIPGCHMTTNRSAFKQADVVFFRHVDIYPSVTSLPQEKRPKQQMWIWMSMESPNIYTPYGKLIPNTDQHYTIPKKGSCLAAWVVSNYKKHHKRTSIVKSLQNYMTIDIYGKGNGKPLSPETLQGTISKYPFYLAFENSVHQDYITEKLWRNSFMSGSVPVVFGPPRSNYEKFVPPGSFIHVEDFPSTKELAEYLKRVAKNETLYKQYFEWKKQFKWKLGCVI
uniref:Fucosyltransferase n=1 Tax=Erpetoichthys calabaricus TaxID=27687 RepID=A0A8C4SP92_ERPCA